VGLGIKRNEEVEQISRDESLGARRVKNLKQVNTDQKKKKKKRKRNPLMSKLCYSSDNLM
jgi:hypothetical protein